jgi:transposase-like protein
MVNMSVNVYSQEYRDEIVKEATEVGNTTMVARKHGLNKKTVNAWVVKAKGTTGKQSMRNLNKVRKEINTDPVCIEEALKQNEKLKNLLGERELEIAVLRDLLKKTNTPYPKR